MRNSFSMARPIPSPRTNGENTLHGGVKGFDKALWTPRRCPPKTASRWNFPTFSKDGDEGFPGNLKVTVTYTWTDANALQIEYSATTDKKTSLGIKPESTMNFVPSIIHLVAENVAGALTWRFENYE